jgi:hypothetical protein
MRHVVVVDRRGRFPVQPSRHQFRRDWSCRD